MNTPPHIIIIGCGFGGLAAAKRLAHLNFKVTLVDKTNHHIFKPLLPMVASAELSPFSVSVPARAIFRGYENVSVLMTTVLRIDAANKQIETTEGSLSFDHLIVAVGAEPNYFGNETWAQKVLPLSTLSDARKIRNAVLSAFEEAEASNTVSGVQQDGLLNFVIVGAGSTGIELAGSFATLVGKVLSKRNFRRINPADAQIYLVELADRVLPLPTIGKTQSQYAEGILKQQGVKVMTSCKVINIDEAGVLIEKSGGGLAAANAREGKEETLFIPARTVIWSAGVKASAIVHTLGVSLDRSGRVPVNGSLNIEGHDCVYVIGDAARFEQDGKPLPGLASVAKQMGTYAAEAIAARLSGKAISDFRYRRSGTVVTVTEGNGIAVFGKHSLVGFSAWIIWLIAHVYFLIGHRNRSLVLIQWLYSWLGASLGARIITDDPEAKTRPSNVALPKGDGTVSSTKKN